MNQQILPKRKIGVNEHIVTGGLKRKAKATLGKFPFLEQAISMFYAAKDDATSAPVRHAFFSCLTYFIMPLDAIPDFIPLLGLLDDWLILAIVFGLLHTKVKDNHIQSARDFIDHDVKGNSPAHPG